MRHSLEIERELTAEKQCGNCRDDSGLSLVATFVALVLVAAVVLAPLAIVIAVPALLTIAYHHAWVIANTRGSVATFVLLLGIDILLLVAVIGLFLNASSS